MAPAVGEGAGVPQWWDSAAVLDADYANDRVSFDGLRATEADFNTANAVVKSGEQRSFPVYVDPAEPELLADGGFTSGVDSWAETPVTAANGSLAQVGGELVATATTTGYKIARAITLAADTPYRLLMDRVGTTGSTAGVFVAGTSAIELTGASQMNHSGNGTKELDFSDDATAQYIGWSLTGTGTITFDNASVKACVPLKGHSNTAISGRISAVAPVGVAANKTLLHIGDDGSAALLAVARNSLWLYRNTSGNMILAVKRNAVDVASLDLGAVADSAAFTVAFACTTNRFSASLNGGPIVTDTAGVLPGLPRLRIGRNYAGTAGQVWDGTVSRGRLYAEALSDAELVDPAKAIVIWGDSLATSTGASVAANAWWNLLAADLGWTVVSKGNGGDDTAAEVVRFNADTAYRDWLNIFIDRPNTNEASSTWLANIADMASKVSRYFVVPPLLNSASGLPDTSATAITAVQSALLAGQWAGHSLDSSAQAALQATMDSDATRSDTIHFNDTGHAAVKASVKTGLQAVGLVP